jgi:hypothetical protein
MERHRYCLAVCLIVLGCLGYAQAQNSAEPPADPATQPTTTQPTGEGSKAEAIEPAESAATQPEQPAEDPMAQQRQEAAEAYQEMADAYLGNDWEALSEFTRSIRRHQRFLNRDQRLDVTYMLKTAREFQPKWWHKCSSSSNISFKAELWNRPLLANYMPTRMLGAQSVQAEGEYRKNRRGEYEPVVTKINVIVTWKPGMVGSNTPGTGKLADIHGMTQGDLGEVIVWHELGHCYITNYLPMKHVMELYDDHAMLFSHLQEFYADVTALHHTSPRARRISLILRLEGLDRYDDSEQHARASHAVGSLVLHEVLANPDDWPSFHFPPSVPKQQVELNTIIYLYEHMDPKWSVKEARALRELAGSFIKKSGEKTLRARGVLPLPNRLKFSLMAGQDHKLQTQRDEYVAERLEAFIESGRADTLEEDETYDPPLRRPLRDGEEYRLDPEALRIDIPM